MSKNNRAEFISESKKETMRQSGNEENGLLRRAAPRNDRDAELLNHDSSSNDGDAENNRHAELVSASLKQSWSDNGNIEFYPDFKPDDFKLKSDSERTQIDSNFASVSYWKEVRIRFFSNKSAVLSAVAIIVIMFFAFAGPHFTKYTYSEQNLEQKNYAPRIQGLEKLGIFNGDENMRTTSGSRKTNLYEKNGDTDVYYWFGSDTLGRDIWTRTWMGTRVSLYISIVAVLIDMIIGLSFGLISGYFGGMTDSVMQRFAEIVNGIPRLVIVTLLMLILKPGIATIIFALMITEWIGMSRIARAEMLNLKEREFVLASRTLGAGNFSIILHEILPNINGQVITQTMFSIPTAIFTEAFLSFVGLGIPVPQCSLGSLISDAFNSFTTHPYQIIPPIVVLAVLMLSFNILADGLREAIDPKFKEQ